MILPSSLFKELQKSRKEDVSDYVAHLQVHMSLQARNLLPGIEQMKQSRESLLYQTQAQVEKITSRVLT
ncbi:MAG: hypothetical protein NZ901_08195 [Geminocystis sp.]|nr:hypothetical protein [Geminocystis sp.]HIK37630.1 hypothetical protein [Geminocystis sp. M7585_C2015_104]MCS7148153.1 hypothetical protein [Geminocystis sp.]MCX8078106.1 hypothetical protein [Geminocystis sp.]MDW8116504.1 hypothetical protein [Geminocystis sp.]